MKKIMIVESKWFDEHHEFEWKPFEFYFETKNGKWLKLNDNSIKELTIHTEDEIRERYLKQYHDDLSRAVISADVEIQVWRKIKGG